MPANPSLSLLNTYNQQQAAPMPPAMQQLQQQSIGQSTQDPISNSTPRNMFDNMVEWGLQKYADYKTYKKEPLETNQKIFFDTFINKSKENITEKDFKKEELEYLKTHLDKQLNTSVEEILPLESLLKEKMNTTNKKWSPGYIETVRDIANSISKYRKTGVIDDTLYNIVQQDEPLDYWKHYLLKESGIERKRTRLGISDYLQYGTGEGIKREDAVAEQRTTSGHTPESIIHTTLGRFNAKFNPKTQEYTIEDDYDFASKGFLGTKQAPPGYEGGVEAGGGASIPYNILRTYAGRRMQEGVDKPRKVLLSISRGGEKKR